MQHVNQSPTDQAFVQNPYDFYDRARKLGAIVYWSDYEMPVALSHSAVNAILRDRRFGREEPAEMRAKVRDDLAPFYAIEAHSMLELEPPRHTRLRGLVLRAFTNRRIMALGPEIEALCHTLIGAMPTKGGDLLADFAQPLPVIVIARLLGVPESMAGTLLRWSNAMVGMYQARRTPAMETAAVDAARDFAAFLRGYVEERRARPGDDLITHLIAAEQDGAHLTTDEMISTCILLLNAGHEATVHSLGNGISALIAAGKPADALVADQIAATVEEILRFDPPLHLFTRWAYEDIEVSGHRFCRGDRVGCLLGAANRDPRAYDDPNLFNPRRPQTQNLAFGAGLHFCVGAPLARLELQIALPVLFARLPALRLDGRPRYADLFHFHGLEALHATW